MRASFLLSATEFGPVSIRAAFPAPIFLADRTKKLRAVFGETQALARGGDQAIWKHSTSGKLLGELSGFASMMSAMWAHQRLQTSVWAIAFQRSSSSISA